MLTFMLAPLPLTLTCIQQLLHHLKVGVRHAVVQRRVPVAVSHVDDVAQHGRRDGPEGPQVVLHHGRHRRLLAGHTKPLVLHRVQTGSLRRQWGDLLVAIHNSTRPLCWILLNVIALAACSIKHSTLQYQAQPCRLEKVLTMSLLLTAFGSQR